ncbi:hypothetical protein N8I77_013185 [Diaporthe amygdali]|uniref:Xylanolytic transcriptional activator regulatory domain-containing protein n=1 Tax=Phomopsis amygdali TaxID=1214568 RepID=A0AAD9S3R8_PHOAM|nr:hypothetical protein N8I77_013185 [Diaporthe amygdali]
MGVCDSERPSCRPCAKLTVECVQAVSTLNTSGTGNVDGRITRRYLHALEQKARAEPASRLSSGSYDDTEQHLSPDVDSVTVQPSPADPRARAMSTFAKTHAGSVIADGGGYRFLRLLFTGEAWRGEQASLLHGLTSKPGAAEAAIPPNQLPAREEARLIFDLYLDGPQIQNPFLLRQDIETTFSRVFNPNSSPAPRDLFRTFMILATGSITLYRSGRHAHHSFGYYRAAMRHFDTGFMADGIPAIQDLLLICRFAIYHHIGTSIWDVIQLCVRMCVQQGLHRPPRRRIPLLEEQLQRRVFWECYMIDRYSSSTLDRPFAIADQDISAAMPSHVNDDDLVAASAIYPDLTTLEGRYTGSCPNEMTVFLACVRLRQITSRIQKFTSAAARDNNRHSSDQPQFLASGKVFCALDELLVALEEWRKSTPVITAPKCLYEKPEYFEFLHAREKLLLIRRTMDVVPKRKGVPPQNLLALCLKTASRGVELFSGLYARNSITYTRSYFSFLFTAGLSIMLSISVSEGSNNDSIYTDSSLKALATCEDTLRRLGDKLPDAKPYVTVFGALHRNVAKKFHQRSSSSRRTVVSTPSWPKHGAAGTEPFSEQQHRQPEVFNRSYFSSQNRFQELPEETDDRASLSMNMLGLRSPQSGETNPGTSDLQGIRAELDRSDIFPLDITSPSEYSTFPWVSLTEDNTLWTMEAGLSEYAYGDASFNMALFQ